MLILGTIAWGLGIISDNTSLTITGWVIVFNTYFHWL